MARPAGEYAIFLQASYIIEFYIMKKLARTEKCHSVTVEICQ